jgi:hypothetical protein
VEQRAEPSIVSKPSSELCGALSASRTEHLHRNIEPNGAPLARRTEHRQRAERGVVGEPSGASSPEYWGCVEHRQRDERSTDSKPSGALSASRTEYLHWSIGAARSTVSETSGAPTASRAGSCRRDERSIFAGASEPRGAPSARRAEQSIVTRASEPSGAPSARRLRSTGGERSRALSPEHRSRAEHHQRAERSTVSETRGVASAQRSNGSGPSGALSAKRRPERSIVSKLSSERHLRLSPKPVCHHREQLPASREEHRPRDRQRAERNIISELSGVPRVR